MLDSGKKSFKGSFLKMEEWSPMVGCATKESLSTKIWIRVVSLLVHLWTHEVLKSLGDECGGFVAIDEKMALKLKMF